MGERIYTIDELAKDRVDYVILRYFTEKENAYAFKNSLVGELNTIVIKIIDDILAVALVYTISPIFTK